MRQGIRQHSELNFNKGFSECNLPLISLSSYFLSAQCTYLNSTPCHYLATYTLFWLLPRSLNQRPQKQSYPSREIQISKKLGVVLPSVVEYERRYLKLPTNHAMMFGWV